MLERPCRNADRLARHCVAVGMKAAGVFPPRAAPREPAANHTDCRRQAHAAAMEQRQRASNDHSCGRSALASLVAEYDGIGRRGCVQLAEPVEIFRLGTSSISDGHSLIIHPI